MKLILIRHGRSKANIKGLIEGVEGDLSELGRKQAQKIALKLRDKKFDHIYSSDMPRARQTTEIIARHIPNTPIHYTRKLREFQISPSLEGRKASTINWEKLPNDSETKEEMYNRILIFLQNIYRKHSDETLLLITHYHVIRTIYNILSGNNFNNEIRFDQRNDSITVLNIKNISGI